MDDREKFGFYHDNFPELEDWIRHLTGLVLKKARADREDGKTPREIGLGEFLHYLYKVLDNRDLLRKEWNEKQKK